MAIYAIGDIQGCYDSLLRLVDKIQFNPAEDQLWFTGDLVNRGPDSAAVLRWVKAMGNSAITVLGNHDLHLLAIARGHSHQRRSDTFDELLSASDRDELLDWLQHQPLLHHDEKINTTMVHAGIPPGWDLTLARRAANEVEVLLQSEHSDTFFQSMYGNLPALWHNELQGLDRIRYITNALTRMRYCELDGSLNLKENGAPGTQPKSLKAWFKHPLKTQFDSRIVFGHWSTLGFIDKHNVLGLDTGCLWGGKLTAAQLDSQPLNITQIKCKQCKPPTNSES